jgi:hypothetical protein
VSAAFEVDEAYESSEREPRCGWRRHNHPQAPDFLPPSRRKDVALGVLAFVPHSAHAERELVLRVHECRRDVSSHRVDTASKEHAVGDDVPVLARAHRPPDFPSQLFADQVARMSGAKSGTSPWARMRLWRASGAICRLCLEQNPDIASLIRATLAAFHSARSS